MKPTSEASPLESFETWSLEQTRFGLLAAVFCLASLSLLFLGRMEITTGSAKAAALPAATNICQPFEQVNDDAFGLGTGADGTYASEEGFEVAIFNNQLYLGMEADNSMGARLWRTKPGITQPQNQADWEEVAADANGYPFGVAERAQADHIDSLIGFNDYLYVSTANGGSNTLGTRIFRSATGDPGTWEDAIVDLGPGFGDVNNMNFKDMQVFQNHLCGGTQNWLKGAQVWCTSDGTTWMQKNISGFGKNFYNSDNREIWSGFVFEGALYFGVQDLGAGYYIEGDDIARLFRTHDISGEPKWTEVYTGEPGSYRVDILGELDGHLYISTRSGNGVVVLRSADGSANSWLQITDFGIDGETNNEGTVVDGAETIDDVLYLSVSNSSGGVELWQTTGTLQTAGEVVDWTRVDEAGLGDAENMHAQLIAFNGSLYAWTSNYASGQQVLRTACSLSTQDEVAPTATATATQTPAPTSTPEVMETPVPLETATPDSENPVLTPTQTPLPTAHCPAGADDCQESQLGDSRTWANFVPLVIRSSP